MADPVRTPGVLECCAAATGMVWGAVRPRRPDQRFLRSVEDAGLPESPRHTVRVTALPQSPRQVPTAAVAEGTFTPFLVANALNSFVVEHPRATFLVDPSVCHDVEQRAIAQLPAVLRPAVRPPADSIPTVTGLRRMPNLPTPDFALPTHAHWDHVCGLLDLPDLPVRLHRVEHEWVSTGPFAPAGGVRDALRDRTIDDYELDGPPVLTFTASHDLFGDGTVLLVDLAGHTPGSVGILLHTRQGWVLLAGDAAWHTRQIDDVRQKASYPGNFADDDRAQTFRTLQRLHLARHRVRIVPTHDHSAATRLEPSRAARNTAPR
ncbi:MBL fold metallo-hydrolase [Nocardia callitridis]|uniref:MBL fold metallo-hydrolase n=1 Tax=Nocardia callitridis TaxID=648753 RepID=A0ABP9KGI4_9NOCA